MAEEQAKKEKMWKAELADKKFVGVTSNSSVYEREVRFTAMKGDRCALWKACGNSEGGFVDNL